MTEQQLISLRVPENLVERADRLIEPLGSDPNLPLMGAVNRSGVLRLALLYGIQALEEKYRPRRSR